MKKKNLVAIILSLALAMTCFTGCGNSENAGSNSGDVKTQVLSASLGHVMAVDSPADQGAKKFAELVAEKTKGTVVIEVFPNSQLGADRDMIEAQSMGGLDFSLPGTSIYSQFEPSVAVFCLPFLFEDKEAAYKVLDGEAGEQVYSVTENQNIKVLTTFESGFRQLGTNREVNGIEDLKGLKIRIPQGEIYLKTWSALGVNGTPLAWNELFTALQTKVVDGEEAPLANFSASGFGEVCKYFAYINYAYDPLMLTVSMDFWDKLNDEQKTAVQEAAYEARDFEREVNSNQEMSLEAELIQTQGLTFTRPELAPFREAVSAVYEEYEYQDTLALIRDALN